MKKLVAIAVAILLFASACNWRYAQTVGNSPMRWTCGPIAYKINPYNSNSWQHQQIMTDMGQLGAKMNRVVYFAGFTNETLRGNGPARGFILFEYYWPPDAPSGYGWTRRTIQGNYYIGANTYLNAPAVIHSNIVKHEAGHTVGLDHVSDPQEIMDPTRAWQNSDWGPGTSFGLSELGKC